MYFACECQQKRLLLLVFHWRSHQKISASLSICPQRLNLCLYTDTFCASSHYEEQQRRKTVPWLCFSGIKASEKTERGCRASLAFVVYAWNVPFSISFQCEKPRAPHVSPCCTRQIFLGGMCDTTLSVRFTWYAGCFALPCRYIQFSCDSAWCQRSSCTSGCNAKVRDNSAISQTHRSSMWLPCKLVRTLVVFPQVFSINCHLSFVHNK